jgi:hypothetical protein
MTTFPSAPSGPYIPARRDKLAGRSARLANLAMRAAVGGLVWREGEICRRQPNDRWADAAPLAGRLAVVARRTASDFSSLPV